MVGGGLRLSEASTVIETGRVDGAGTGVGDTMRGDEDGVRGGKGDEDVELLCAVQKEGSIGECSRDGVRVRTSSSVSSGMDGGGKAGGESESSSNCRLRYSRVGVRERRLYGERDGRPDAILTLNPSRWAPDDVSSCGVSAQTP